MKLPRSRVLAIWLVIGVLVIPQLIWIMRQEYRHFLMVRLDRSARVMPEVRGKPPDWMPVALQKRWWRVAGDVCVNESPTPQEWRLIQKLGSPQYSLIYWDDYPEGADWEALGRCQHLTRLTVLEHASDRNDVLLEPTLEEFRHLTRLPRLMHLELTGYRLGAEHFRILAGIPTLKSLNLQGGELEPEGLAFLEALPELEELDVNNTNVRDEDLVHIERLEGLRYLGVGFDVTDEGVESICRLRNLEEIFFNSCLITNAGLDRLLELPELKHLELFQTGISGDRIDELAVTHPHLELQVVY